MGMMKAGIEMEEQQRMEAEDILVEAKALKRCDKHGEVYDIGVVDLQPAYRYANSKFSRGEVSGFRNRPEMTDMMKAVHKKAAMNCWQCEKLQDD